jgi:uncharacterized protein YeaO (DUF488 family)
MPILVVRLGTPRAPDEGPRLGTVRRPPRGIKKADYGRLHYYDLWLPDLAPSTSLVSYAFAKRWTLQRWAIYARRYRSEMRAPAAQRLITLLAALSPQANFSVGCYCEDETRCHRSLLREMLVEAKAKMV